MPAPLPSQRHLFNLPEGVTYLNCAYFSPMPRPVQEAGRAAIAVSAAPWQRASDDFFEPGERLRADFATLIGGDAEGVAFVPSASYGVGVAAANVELGPGRQVVLIDEEFPSDVYPWRAAAASRGGDIVTIPRPADGKWTPRVLDAIGTATAVVVVPQCHWTDGSRFDLGVIGEAAHAVGAALVVDASQSLGAFPFSVGEVRPDYLISVGYKWLMGPYSFGFLWAAEEHRDQGLPLEWTWSGRKGSEDFARLIDYTDELRPGARRFDFGEWSSFVLLPMAAAAVALILEWGPERVAAGLAPLTARVEEGARRLGLEPVAAENRLPHLLGVRFPAGVPPGLPLRLAEERIHVSVRGSSVRVSPHLYNDGEDVERLLVALGELA